MLWHGSEFNSFLRLFTSQRGRHVLRARLLIATEHTAAMITEAHCV